jgi:5-methylcytosine-specific restriction endonuclease McrA
MTMAVLLLNVDGAPARVIDERRAWSLLQRGRAVIVLEQAQPLRSAHGSQPRPSVMYLTRFARVGEVAWSRREVLIRDGYRCAYCGGPGNTVDHVVPKHLCRTLRRVHSNWTNTVTACAPCNHRKGGRTLAEAGMRFRPGYQPAAPRHVRPSLLRLLQERTEWRPFLPAAWQPTPQPL